MMHEGPKVRNVNNLQTIAATVDVGFNPKETKVFNVKISLNKGDNTIIAL